MLEQQSFKIIPILGRKVNVPSNDPSLFKFLSDSDNVALTYDVGGINFDLRRKSNACTKSNGYSIWSNSANAQATKCLGLFMLYDGTNRDYLFFDNGKFYVYDAALDPQDKSAAGVTLATDNVDLYSIIKVGSYAVFTDRGEHTPYAWKNGDANAAKLISSGTEYKFRYLEYFANRIIGAYSDQTNGDIEIRWSGSLSTPTSSCSFAAGDQLYVINDDPIVGIHTMGQSRCYIYSEDSINQFIYSPDSSVIFQIYTVVPKQGSVNHHSIINLGDRHLLFNKNYGFCEYTGGDQVTPISGDIEADLTEMNSEYYNLIVGTTVPLTRNVVWTVPMQGESSPNRLLFYNIDTKQFWWEDKSMRYVDNWLMYDNMTWNDLITELGGAGAVWSDIGTHTWAYYLSRRQRLVYANTDGKLYYHTGESLAGSALDGYRIEPIMDFGDYERRDLLSEIWFDLVEVGSFSIDISHRSGNTIGELEAQSWTSLGSISCNSPEHPVLYCNQYGKYHQIKWGTNAASEKFMVNAIIFKYMPQGVR